MDATVDSPNELVRLESCRDVPRADLARMALAREEIPAWFGNANFLSWFWHYGIAVGGVTIHVRRREVERARQVLAAARTKIAESLPPWICSSCGQRVAGQWDACWQCGHFVDGTPGAPFAEPLAAQLASGSRPVPWLTSSRLFTLVATAVLMLVVLKLGPQTLLILAPFIGVFIFLLRQFGPSADGPSELPAEAQPSDLSPGNLSITRSRVSRAIVQRAWQAGVLSIAFFPLGLYSMRLLWKLSDRDTPLSRADNWRCWTAFFLNIASTLFYLPFVWFVLREVLGALARL